MSWPAWMAKLVAKDNPSSKHEWEVVSARSPKRYPHSYPHWAAPVGAKKLPFFPLLSPHINKSRGRGKQSGSKKIRVEPLEAERWGSRAELFRNLFSQVRGKIALKHLFPVGRDESIVGLSVTRGVCKLTECRSFWVCFSVSITKKNILELFCSPLSLFLDVALAGFLHNKPPNGMNAWEVGAGRTAQHQN